jgi:GntR family transcriptional regulator
MAFSDKETDRRPLYQKAADELLLILEKTEPGTFLPSEPELARQLGVSRATLREAMRTFEGRGWIVRKQGVGTYVTQPPRVLESGLEVLESIETIASRIELDVDVGALEIEEREPSAVESKMFGEHTGQRVLRISRVILAEDRPVAYLIDVLPVGVLPKSSLERDFNGSVLDLLLERGDPILSHSKTEITAVAAPPHVARKLRIQRGDVLVRLDAWLFTNEAAAIDRSESYFLPGTFRLHLVRRVASLIN